MSCALVPIQTVGGYDSGEFATMQLHVAGATADRLGTITLQRLANETGAEVHVGPGSEYHDGLVLRRGDGRSYP